MIPTSEMRNLNLFQNHLISCVYNTLGSTHLYIGLLGVAESQKSLMRLCLQQCRVDLF